MPPIQLNLEYAVEFIADDELVEVTPQSIRIRKRHLKELPERKKVAAKRPRSLKSRGRRRVALCIGSRLPPKVNATMGIVTKARHATPNLRQLAAAFADIALA